jgi:ADP-ribose pyrophosphatase YjhB (NUDIX family)
MNNNSNIEVITRAVIISDGKLVVCKAKGKDWYFLPGGHVEFGELAKGTLVREIKEEMGVDAVAGEFIDVIENIYEQDGAKHHEINLVFLVQMTDVKSIVSQEDHIDFEYIDTASLSDIKLLPDNLKRRLLEEFSKSL